jgi:OFA family oxalate/formate antiporter-like MFS transporter
MIAIAIAVGIPCFLVTGYTNNVTIFVVTYSIGFGFVGGTSYMVPIHNTWGWFPKRAGLFSGLIIGSIGLGAIVFEEVAVKMVNPNNIAAVDGVFPPEVTQNIPKYV